MPLYLLHFEPPCKHARHYLGYARCINKRVSRHIAGNGSGLVRAAVQAGCSVTVVRTFDGGGNAESDLKRSYRSQTRLCPACNPNATRLAKVYRSKCVCNSIPNTRKDN